MRYALYLGCAIPVKGLKYELSARNLASKLGIELIDLKGFACCGFPVKSMDSLTALYLAARNLALAEEQGLDIVGLCSGCIAVLSEAVLELKDDLLRQEINRLLKADGIREYKGKVSVKHMARLLAEEPLLSLIEKKKLPVFSEYRFAIHYGCHYLKPSIAHNLIEDPDRPHSLSRIIGTIGSSEINYPQKNQCCGITMMASDESIAYRLAGSKLKAVADSRAEALIVACPSCCIAFENNQKIAARAVDAQLSLPVLYYTQAVGLAIGLSEKEAGFEHNRIAFNAT